MDSIIINSTNLRPNNTQYNNIFEYTFPSNVNFKNGDTVALAGMSIYNSFFNIRSSLGNNVYTYNWNADTETTHNVTIPDGFYDIPALNYYFQFEMIQNDHYLIDENGDYVYFMELVLNNTAYGVDFKFTPIPTSVEATALNYTQPVGATWTYPSTKKTPEIILNSSFGKLFGFLSGTYPSVTSDSVTVASSESGAIQQVNSIIITCNLINSPYSNPSNILGSVNLNSAYGSLLQYEASYSVDSLIFPGNYKKIQIALHDQDLNPIKVNDVEGFLMRLVIKHGNNTDKK